MDKRATLEYIRISNDVLSELEHIAKQLHLLDEHFCNYDLTPQQEKQQTQLEQRAIEEAKRLRLQVYRQHDPRGCALYLVTPELNNGALYSRGIAITSR